MSLLSSISPLKNTPLVLPFQYRLVRSARRTLSIEVAKAGVVVRAPHFVALADIEKFLLLKSSWVMQKLTLQSQKCAEIPVRNYVEGGEVLLLGEALSLRLHRQSQADIFQRGNELFIGLSSRSRLGDEEQAKRLVSQWFQRQALHLLTLKTDALVRDMGLKHAGVTIKATRSKWGHCTSRGAIQYNWQILLAPEPIVDYLVAHEVSHLRHHNHSPEFWQLVASVCPDYKKRRAWLKANGASLIL